MSNPLDTYFSDISDRIKAETMTRIHMLNEGTKTQQTALATAQFQTATISESLDMLQRHAKVGQLTRLSHGLVIDQLIAESARIMAQMIAIAHKMEQE